MSVGALIGADDVCEAVETTLQNWVPSLLTELAAAGIELPAVASYSQLPDETASTTAQYPAVLIWSPGLAGAPEQHGDGSTQASWSVVVTVIVRGKDYTETAKRTRAYIGKVIRPALAQHATLGGFAVSTRWTDESYNRARDTQARTLGIGHCVFTVTVNDVLDVYAGPVTPPPAGQTNPPDFQTADAPVLITVET